MSEANRLEQRRILRTAIISATALMLGLITFLVGGVLYFLDPVPASTGSDDGAGDGQSIAALITAIAGLLGAVGGLCGGIAALVMARHTLRRHATAPPEPETAPAPAPSPPPPD